MITRRWAEACMICTCEVWSNFGTNKKKKKILVHKKIKQFTRHFFLKKKTKRVK